MNGLKYNGINLMDLNDWIKFIGINLMDSNDWINFIGIRSTWFR